jgi:hypothetical protein
VAGTVLEYINLRSPFGKKEELSQKKNNLIVVTNNNNNSNNNNNNKPVYEEGDVTVLWNQAVHTDREVTANSPDIIIKKIKEKTCTLIDVAIPEVRNVMQKEAEKKLKYKSLCIEIQRMWNLKCMIIPVIIGATGVVTRSLRKNLEIVPGKHSIDSLQKTAILGTSHIIRKALQCEAGSLSSGDHCWFKRTTRKEKPVIRDR